MRSVVVYFLTAATMLSAVLVTRAVTTSSPSAFALDLFLALTTVAESELRRACNQETLRPVL